MSTPVHAVATPFNTRRASRACRDNRVAPYATSATQHVTTFPCAQMHGQDSVSLRDAQSGIWASLASSAQCYSNACKTYQQKVLMLKLS